MPPAAVLRASIIGLAIATGGGSSAGANGGTRAMPAEKSYVAVAMSDGPTSETRLSLTFRGADATQVVSKAVRACYEQASPGFMHTCQIWYGTAWVVGTACRQSASSVKFAIGDDPNSPEAAEAKAIAHLRDVEHADVSDCRVVAQDNADAVQVARSAATARP